MNPFVLYKTGGLQMRISEITRIANNYTDEVFTNLVCLDFANETIAKINVALGTKLPYMSIVTGTTDSADYTALPEEWIRTVVVPYVCYSIKLSDGSINESQINFLQRYEQGIRELRKNKKLAIAEEYRGENFGGIATMPKLGKYEKHPDDLEEEENYHDKIPL
jgi:hypothetical protein